LKVPAASTLDLDTLDTAALKALIRSQDEQLSWRAAEIERLKLLIVRLQRMQFGRKSEKLEREIRQLELQLDDLEESAAQNRQRASTGCLRQPPRCLLA
jgi:transposase